jgi:serine/threonine protein kinase
VEESEAIFRLFRNFLSDLPIFAHRVFLLQGTSSFNDSGMTSYCSAQECGMAPVHGCLDEQTLQRLVRGELQDEDAQFAERHIQHCPHCASLLDLQFASLIDVLRLAASTTSPHPEQEQIDRLVLQLEALVSAKGQSGQIKGPSAPPDPPLPPPPPPDALTAAAEELEEGGLMLGPPLQADEIGWLGPYRVIELVGEGGMGAVFRAEDTMLKRTVAIKVLRRGAGSKHMRQRFLREARAIASLDHDHIVPIWQFGEDNGQPFIVMPLLRGERLSSLLSRQGPLPLPLVLQIARETASALAAAHQAGQIHRDIKPDNIWLETRQEGARVRVLDFGLAASSIEQGRLSHPAVILGTPQYMAPEQACGGAVNARTDLFSLGCVLYECLTGCRPFAGRNLLAVLWSLAHHDPQPLYELVPDAPRSLTDLVMRLLARQPQGRPGSAEEVVSAIREIIVQEGNGSGSGGQAAPLAPLLELSGKEASPDRPSSSSAADE